MVKNKPEGKQKRKKVKEANKPVAKMPALFKDNKNLDLFYRLSSGEELERQRSTMILLNQLLTLKRTDKDAFSRMADYTLGRLIRAHTSSNLQTRGYMFTSLTAILRSCDGIENESVSALIEKSLAVEEEDTKSIKLNKRLAIILTCGALLHSRNIKGFSNDILEELLRRITQNAVSKHMFMEYATPFLIEVFQKIKSERKKKSRRALFQDVVQPTLAPYFENIRKPENNLLYLRIALALHESKLGEEDEFLRDQDAVVEALMANDVLEDKELEMLFRYYRTSNPIGIETFWNIFTANLSSAHLNHLCSCIEVCSKEHSILAALNEKVLKSLYYTISHVREHKVQAETTLNTILKWISSSPYILQCPAEREDAIKILFTGEFNILHQYKHLASPLKNMLLTLEETELIMISNLCFKMAESEKASTALRITVINFLGKIAQAKKVSASSKSDIVKMILTIGKDKLSDLFPKQSEDDNDDNEVKEEEEGEELLNKCRSATLSSILSSTWSVEFLDELLNNPEVIEELRPKNPTPEYEAGVNTARKLLKAGKKDQHLHYVIATYVLYYYLNPALALPIIDELTKLCSERKSKTDKKETAKIIFKVVTENILKEEQPLLNYKQLFSKLMAKDLIDDEMITELALIIDVSPEDDSEDEDDDDESSGEEGDSDTEKVNGDAGGSDDDSEEDEEDENDETIVTVNGNNTSIPSSNPDEDSDASIDLDDAKEEDLKRLDMILANAARSRVNDESIKEERYTHRVKGLLQTVIKRKKNTPLGEVLQKKIKLV